MTDLPPHPRIHRGALSVVVAAMAVIHWIENQTGWSIKKFVRTARSYRTVRIKVR
jgi:hypothetical protein